MTLLVKVLDIKQQQISRRGNIRKNFRRGVARCLYGRVDVLLVQRGQQFTGKRRLNFMAKKSLFSVPFVGWLISHMGAFSVDRKNADIGAIRSAIKIVEGGHILSIFPEGTRSLTGEFRQFKYGAALIAARTHAQIVPVVMQHKRVFMTRPVISIGEPFELEPERLNDTGNANLELITMEMYKRMKRLKDEYRFASGKTNA